MSDTSRERLVTRWRLENLKNTIDALGIKKALARKNLSNAIGISAFGRDESASEEDIKKLNTKINNELGKFLSNTNPVGIGHKWSSYIEDGIKHIADNDEKEGISRIPDSYCAPCFLDTPPDTNACAYILAEVRLGHWNILCTELQKIFEIKEISLIFGDSIFNCFIKIESTMSQLNNLIINKIASNINILKTHTLHVTPDSQYQQRQQHRNADFNKLMSGELMSEALEYFDENKFEQPEISKLFFDQWKRNVHHANKAGTGILKIRQSDQLKKLPSRIIKDAKQRILAVVIWNNARDEAENDRNIHYLEEQKKKIAESIGFEIRRIFLLPDISEPKKDMALAIRIGLELDAGVTLRYSCHWPSLRKNDKPRDFGIADSFAFWHVQDDANDDNLRIIEIRHHLNDPNGIKENIADFERLWDNSKELPIELKEYCKKSWGQLT